ncbi:FAD synthase [Mycoplasmopsis agassizii]|uniref:FAD synthase n=1 Tax=Mycoplasmopsis agassizii TaxID=33922 RepID=UPI003527058E
MKTYIYPNKSDARKQVFLLGGYETFHKGHESLFDVAKTYRDRGYEIVLTAVVDARKLPKSSKILEHRNFMQLANRLQVFADYGFDSTVLWKFEDVEGLTFEEFFKPLEKDLDKFAFIVGSDWSGGHKGICKADRLKELYEDVIVVDLFEENRSKISTSLLKSQLSYGHIDFINQNLALNYNITVELNKNLEFEYPGEIEPIHSGVYLVYIDRNDQKIPAVLHKGKLKNKIHVLIDDLTIEPGKVTLEFIETVRIITAAHRDSVSQDDFKNSKILFLRHQDEENQS